jgi:hypothetical protein
MGRLLMLPELLLETLSVIGSMLQYMLLKGAFCHRKCVCYLQLLQQVHHLLQVAIIPPHTVHPQAPSSTPGAAHSHVAAPYSVDGSAKLHLRGRTCHDEHTKLSIEHAADKQQPLQHQHQHQPKILTCTGSHPVAAKTRQTELPSMC